MDGQIQIDRYRWLQIDIYIQIDRDISIILFQIDTSRQINIERQICIYKDINRYTYIYKDTSVDIYVDIDIDIDRQTDIYIYGCR